MATLREAVESGRRWRHKSFSCWLGPGFENDVAPDFTAREALSSDFEIEPEPEKPREWRLHVFAQDVHAKNDCPTQLCEGDKIRVHDADECDRLRAKP